MTPFSLWIELNTGLLWADKAGSDLRSLLDTWRVPGRGSLYFMYQEGR